MTWLGTCDETDSLHCRHRRILARVVRGCHRYWFDHDVGLPAIRRQSDGRHRTKLAKSTRNATWFARWYSFFSCLDKEAERVKFPISGNGHFLEMRTVVNVK